MITVSDSPTVELIAALLHNGWTCSAATHRTEGNCTKAARIVAEALPAVQGDVGLRDLLEQAATAVANGHEFTARHPTTAVLMCGHPDHIGGWPINCARALAANEIREIARDMRQEP